MALPFSHDAFLDVFAQYNAVLWPAVLLFWVASAILALQLLRRRQLAGWAPFALLAAHWAWSGIAYHWLFFRPINPAAAFFAAFFVLQALLFVWLARTSRARFAIDSSPRGLAGGAFVLYSLAYPLVGLGFGLQYPQMPIFAVPCPTTLLTAGLLLTSSGLPRLVNLVPILWAGVGSTAAFALGVQADLALIVAAALLALDTVAPTALGQRAM